MIWLVLLIFIVSLVVVVAVKGREAPQPVDPEQATRAAIELHAIRRRLDVAWTKSEQRHSSSQLRRDIAEALDSDADAP